MFNSDQMKSLVRAFLVMVCGGTFGVWLANHGVPVDDNFYTMAAGLIAGVFSVVWSQIVHKDTPA